jgi:lysophospholipase L1-like esterase
VPRPDRRPRARAVTAVALLALTGCTTPSETGAGATGPAAGEVGAEARLDYVALGDSFTAAPYVPRTDLAEGCFRSSGNYPSLVAAELDARLTDVSCSGADTSHVLGRQRVGLGGAIPAQIAAVGPGTDLVTVSIGGNDEDLFATAVSGCARPAATSCSSRVQAALGDVSAVVAATGRRVTAVLEAVRRAAPDALVLLVGYPRLASPDGGCPAMPLRAGDVPLLVGLEEDLDEALADAAARAGVEFVGLREESSGHEVCSDDPWVNGRRTDQTRALAFHPFASGQQAVAEAVLRRVAERES